MCAKMSLLDVVRRPDSPTPWTEGDNIPWDDPDFSKRMLAEHLSQEHDAASRRLVTIDKHVQWIHRLLLGRPTRILDLGCGPGLYTSRLARLGHQCVGIDFSPASLQYAMDQARQDGLQCKYFHQDIRSADYGTGYDLAMLTFGEFNVFLPTDAGLILSKANRALPPNGLLLLEPHTYSSVQRMGQQPPSWHSAMEGLFSDKPHIRLAESFWDPVRRAATIRYFVVDAATGGVTRYAQSLQAYTDQEYCSLLHKHSFTDVEFYPSLTGSEDKTQEGLIAIVSRKRGLISRVGGG